MKELETALLREKFIIHDLDGSKGAGKDSVIALSNRMVLDLSSRHYDRREMFVLRAQNMHSCVRMAARLVHSAQQTGSLVQRAAPYDWNHAWASVVNDYEQSFNPQRWVSVYHEGRAVFGAGTHHTLLDVIEKCESNNDRNYEHAVRMAEDIFAKAGKPVRIEYKDNMALSLHLQEREGRMGLIIRGPNRTTTFNYSVTAMNEKPLNIPLCLIGAAAFLEGVQLAFLVGFNEEKIRRGMIERHSKDERQTIEARKRLSRLNAEIADMEAASEIHYRPERPDFHHILVDAEKQAKKILAS